jgi:hypothetical protein
MTVEDQHRVGDSDHADDFTILLQWSTAMGKGDHSSKNDKKNKKVKKGGKKPDAKTK